MEHIVHEHCMSGELLLQSRKRAPMGGAPYESAKEAGG